MADLKFDTEAIQQSAEKYEQIAKDMSDLKNKLQLQIDDMRSTYWDSKGGEAFMSLYKSNWATNVEKYTKVMNQLSFLLKHVNSNYYKPLEQRAQKLHIKNLSDI